MGALYKPKEIVHREQDIWAPERGNIPEGANDTVVPGCIQYVTIALNQKQYAQ
jgi:hypothetical protein